jgi:hypothetical protein
LPKRLVQRGFRLLLVGFTIWIGWSTITTLSEVCSGPRQTQNPVPAGQPRSMSAPLDVSALTAGGRWSFAGSPLRVRSTGRDRKRVIELLDAFPSETTSRGAPARGSAALGLMQALKAPRRSVDGGGIYALNRGNMMARVFTRGEPGKEEFVAARLALPSPDGWVVLESTSAEEDSLPPGPTLLPLPGTVRRVCDRHDDGGQSAVEVVSVEAMWADLQTYWRSQGWSVEQTLAADGPSWACTCWREGQTVDVLAHDNPTEPGHLTLMFIRTPSAQVIHE